MEEGNMQGVIYCRKSSEDKNKQILSLQDQLTICKRIIQDRGIKLIAPPFIEAKTGWKADVRVEFFKMIELVKKGKVDTIVTSNMDRIGRNGEENGICRDLITQGKLLIITPTDVYDTNNILKAGVESLFNEEYSNKLSKIIKARLQLKAERGEYPGNAPLGYSNTPQFPKGARYIVPDERVWSLCRKAWEMMLTGHYTIPQILKKMNSMALTGKKGNPISRTVAFRFFRDIFYTGNFVYSGTTYPGIHKPMITMSEFIRVQKLLDSKNAGSPNSLVDPIPYLGIFKCPCGASITGERKTKHYKNGTSHIFTHYHCTKKKGPCDSKYLRAADLEKQIREYVSQLQLNPEFAEYFRKVLKRRNNEEFNFSIKQRESITKELNDIDERKEKLYGMKIDGIIDNDTYEAKKSKLLMREQVLKEQQTSKRIAMWGEVLDNAINFSKNVLKIFDTGDAYTREMVLKIIGSDLKIKDKKIEIKPNNVFLYFKEAQNSVMENNKWIGPENMSYVWQNRVFADQESRIVPRAGLGPA